MKQGNPREFRVQLPERTLKDLKLLKLVAADNASYATIVARLITDEVERQGGQKALIERVLGE